MKRTSNDESPPPIFGSWPKFYAAVIAWLVVLIISFYIFTVYYS
ncbi:MAG TPA: hypothetical protein VE870_06350 [Bacteroidales bacterium]|nr:hypothetical protein [Bacteroidales bacterium]